MRIMEILYVLSIRKLYVNRSKKLSVYNVLVLSVLMAILTSFDTHCYYKFGICVDISDVEKVCQYLLIAHLQSDILVFMNIFKELDG